MKSLTYLLLFILFTTPITSQEPNADDVRNAYDSFLSKFKTGGGEDGFILTHVGGFWQAIETIEVLIDAYERFKDDSSKNQMIEIAESWLNSKGDNWEWNSYNDDIMWGCIMFSRLYLNTKDEKYLNIAKNNFKMVWDRAWTNDYDGGLLWFKGKTEKNACVNGPGAVAACLLAIATGDNSYYDKAKDIINWMNKKIVQDDGSVWDKIDWDSQKNEYFYGTWVSTYNQGTYIGANVMLYQYTNDQAYLDMAHKGARRATRIEGILNGEDNGGDLVGFKGILARWLGKMVRELNINDYNEWIHNNLQAVWVNRNSDNLMWTKFGAKTDENLENSDDWSKREECAWGCSSALSWVINFAYL